MPDDLEQEQQEPEADDRRAALSAAFDAVEAGEPQAAPSEETAPAGPETAAEEPAAAPTAGRDDKGRFAPGAAAKGNAAPKLTVPGAQAGVAPPAVAIGTVATPPASVPDPWSRAPQSLRPEAREKWASVPPEVQQEIHRRERDTAVAMQRASESQRLVEPLMRAVQPYAQALQARGQSPDQVIGNMLRTEQALSHPDERMRANVLAQALKTYSVSVESLAAALDGAPHQQTQQAINPQEIIRQARDEFARDLQAQRTASASQSAAAEIESFTPAAEFLDDVRDMAADLLESSARRGIALSLQDAYEQACWSSPGIRKVLQQREASKQAATGTRATQRARAAAVSVRSTPGGSASSAPPGESWREHLEAAWDKAQS